MKQIKFGLILFIIIFYAFVANTFAQRKVQLKGNAPKTSLYFSFLLGYAVPINASYIDTYVNQDLYWNPNSGLDIDLRLTYQFNDYFSLTFLPIDLIVGFYQYKTTDGRKVNTEAQAGTNPITTNTEWSIAPNFVPMVQVKPGKHPAIPYIAFGLGVGLMWSFESWDFTNVNGERTVLIIAKYYYPTPKFRAEIGWNIPISKRWMFNIVCSVNVANYMMYKVVLTNYYIDDTDHIGDFDEKSTIYNYAFDVPDENKGGDCLLAGFNYQNYIQQKIGTSASLKIGFSVFF